MVIAAGPSLPSGPLSAADRAATGSATASETSITASTAVASTVAAVTVANNDNYPRIGHNVNDCIQTTMMDDRTDDAEEEEHRVPSLMGVEAFTMIGGNSDDVWWYEEYILWSIQSYPPLQNHSCVLILHASIGP
jgi:hypothetical protein